jgi:hypothetical protein
MEFVKQYQIPNFKEDYKDKFLLAISMTKESHECKFADMSYSDYKNGEEPLYRNLVLDLCDEYFKEYVDSWYCDEYDIKDMWFAEYYDGATFKWHTHEGVNMSAVLQIELDDENNGTELLGMNTRLKEGTLLIFPAMMPHRSPVINNGNKIVIGMNWNMYGSTLNGE